MLLLNIQLMMESSAEKTTSASSRCHIFESLGDINLVGFSPRNIRTKNIREISFYFFQTVSIFAFCATPLL